VNLIFFKFYLHLIYCESFLLIVAACVCSFVWLFLSFFGGEIPTLSLKTAVSLRSNQTNAGRHFIHGSWFQRKLTTNHPESKLALPSWLNRGEKGLTTSLALIPAQNYIHHGFVLIGKKRISVHHPYPRWLLTHLPRPHTHLQKCQHAHKCLPLYLSRTHTYTLTCICSRHSVVTRTAIVTGCWKGVAGITTKAGVTGTVARRCSLTMGVCDLLWQCLVT